MGRPALSIQQRVDADQRAREAILKGMAECIVSKGYRATTVADIAGASRVSKSTLYALFADKEQVFMELYAALTEVQLSVLERADERSRAAGMGWRDRLAVSLRVYIETMIAGGAVTRCLLIEAPAVSERTLAARRDALDRHAAVIQRLVSAVEEDEGLVSVISPSLMVGALGGMNELLMQAFETGDPDVDQLAAEATELLATLFVASVPGPGRGG